MRDRSDPERNRVCDAYEQWLPAKLLDNGAEMRQFQELAQLARDSERLELVCYCAPKRCHADTIKRLLEEELSK